jgi:hypothetical protein
MNEACTVLVWALTASYPSITANVECQPGTMCDPRERWEWVNDFGEVVASSLSHDITDIRQHELRASLFATASVSASLSDAEG